MQAKEILIALAVKHQGNWNSIYTDVQDKNCDDLEQYLSDDIKAITLLDSEYPEQLKQCYKPPFVLFYEGDINLLKDKDIIGITGSRETSEINQRRLARIVSKLNDENKTVVTVDAKGICKAVSLTANKSIIILAEGIKPTDSKLTLSEYPSGTVKTTENCPARNRILSALCSKLAVVSMVEHSGTTITVNEALFNGREIYCMPDMENIDSPCNNLINEGANVLITGNELL